LARVIKEEIPDATIVVGGPQIPYMQDAIVRAPRFFSLVDFVVRGEGERPLLALLRQFGSDRRFSAVPSLIYRADAGDVVQTADAPEIAMAESPEPDFDAYSLDEYWACHRSMPYLTVRGCYWGKCAFCSINSSYGRKLRSKPIPVVVRELATLIEKYGCQSIEFADEAISPARMQALSEAMIEADMKVSWFALTRLEKRFASDILDRAYAAGCRLLSWGLETGSQRMLDRMNKHILREDALRILEQSHHSGIWNHVFIMIGFPGETDEDLEESIAFVQQASGWIDSLNFGRFRLERCTPVFDDPDRFGVRIMPYSATHCSPMYSFQDQCNTERQLQARLQRFERFAASLPASFASSLPIGQRLAILAKTGKTDAEIRGRQESEAARHRKIPEILRSPLEWRVEWDPRIQWEEVSLPTGQGNRVPLQVAICPETGKAILLGKKTAELVRDPSTFQIHLARGGNGGGQGQSPFLDLATVVLKALPFTPHSLSVNPTSGDE
jgi:tRNA A37 methylthiotransferase MiaB